MKFKLNCSPHLRMHEITKKLFNNQFLSDIRFDVGGKIIYAHSLELMKRSVVFEKQLDDTWGEKKLIPVTNCKYANFLEFIRFLYTDECEINDDNGIDLLKLATKYQVVMLEARVINSLNSKEWVLQLFEHCVIEKYEIARDMYGRQISIDYHNILRHKNLLSLHPDAINAILQFDQVSAGLKEIDIFNALAGSINNFCKQQQISLTEFRQRFDDLFKKIRFPTMLKNEVRECVKQYPELFTVSDRTLIANNFFFGDTSHDGVWISKRRTEYKCRNELYKTNCDTKFETKFTVSREVNLYGLWIGTEEIRKKIQIEMTAINSISNESEKLAFTQLTPKHWCRMYISLGESLRLKPNFEYTIAITYLEITDKHILVWCRRKNENLIYNDPENHVRIIKTSGNMLEMIFKLPSE